MCEYMRSELLGVNHVALFSGCLHSITLACWLLRSMIALLHSRVHADPPGMQRNCLVHLSTVSNSSEPLIMCALFVLTNVYRRLHYFSHETTSGLYNVMSSAEADGRVAGYVLDLRNDPGGVFEEAVAMSALFEVGWSAAHDCRLGMCRA